jgi:hypothetical protein
MVYVALHPNDRKTIYPLLQEVHDNQQYDEDMSTILARDSELSNVACRSLRFKGSRPFLSEPWACRAIVPTLACVSYRHRSQWGDYLPEPHRSPRCPGFPVDNFRLTIGCQRGSQAPAGDQQKKAFCRALRAAQRGLNASRERTAPPAGQHFSFDALTCVKLEEVCHHHY